MPLRSIPTYKKAIDLSGLWYKTGWLILAPLCRTHKVMVNSNDAAYLHDTVGESFELNISAAQEAGTLIGTAKPIMLAQGSVWEK
jgi:hypothetical protein